MLELNKIYNMDCIEGMKLIPDNSIDSIVTDPPYEIGFMGKGWDSTGIANNVDMRKECLRILKPGGHLLSFAATRTYHRMACAIEDAGFEVRNQIYRVYGSGFPKSLNIGKQKGCEGWEGRGTGLKPAVEPICMARKPLAEKTVAENVLKYGTGGINIDESRVETGDKMSYSSSEKQGVTQFGTGTTEQSPLGRFPANLITDGSEEVRECFPETGKTGSGKEYKKEYDSTNSWKNTSKEINVTSFADSGNASRFFKSIIYQAKASKSDRGEGNTHSTVKPTALMEYLIKMVTKEGGTVLDPFTGSGTTLVAAKRNLYNYIGFELSKEYCDIIEARLRSVQVGLF